MIRRKQLEIALDRLAPHSQPKVWLEQYTIPSQTAAEMLLIASTNKDIPNKTVVDLGCGTGRLAIGSHILGAKEVIAVDIDPTSIQTAKENARSIGKERSIQWINSDIDIIEGSFDTVVMNPPFGTRNRHADRRFLLKALSIANMIYSLHKRTTRPYLLKLMKDNSGNLEALYEMQLQIPRTYDFHSKKRYNVEVDLHVLRSKT
jgi:putative methylase